MANKKWAKIIVPGIMVIIVVCMWFLQTSATNTPETEDPLALHASSIDLEMLQEYELPMIIDFGADDCAPCKAMAPVLITLNEELQNEAIIKFVDVWENRNGAAGFPVQVIPTQFFYNANGTPYIPSSESGFTLISLDESATYVPSSTDEIVFIQYNNQESGEHLFTYHQGGLTEEQMRHILQDMGVNA